MQLAITYALLSLIAIATNIAAQDISIQLHDGHLGIPIAIAFGTAIGLVTKYILDKRFIFQFRAKDAMHDGKTFVRYAFTGSLTTIVFWGMEVGFHLWFGNKEMRYLGGIIGLALGYFAKYHLDKRFVFSEGPSRGH